MATTVWRVCGARHAATAFSGIGSQRTIGRWHSHQSIVYTTGAHATAVFEVLAHLDAPLPDQGAFCAANVQIEAIIPDEIAILTYKPEDLAVDWDAIPCTLGDYPSSNHAITTDWLSKAETAVMAVPTAMPGNDLNYLINPAHPDFHKIIINPANPLEFDPRIAEHIFTP